MSDDGYYYCEGTSCSSGTYITIDTTTTCSTSSWTIMWWNGTNWEFSQSDPLEKLKQDFEELAHRFFLEKYDRFFIDLRSAPDNALI